MMADRPTWDQSFLAIAKEMSKRSKDPSTKVGAVIVGSDNEVRSLGYNCFPRGVCDGAPGRLERPEKYSWLEHSERNAIFNAARVGIPLKGCRMYITWLPCADCARAIIQSGIEQLVVEDLSVPERWRQSFLVSLVMLCEAGIHVFQPDNRVEVSLLDLLWKGRSILRPAGETAGIPVFTMVGIAHVAVGTGKDRGLVVVSTLDGNGAIAPVFTTTPSELEKLLVDDRE